MEVAVARRLEQELALECKLTFVYKFEYVAHFGVEGTERELCSVFVGRTSREPSANATEIRATLGIRRGGDDLGTLEAGKNAYTIEQQVSNEVGIRSDKLTGEDLFVIAEQIDPDGSVYFRVFVKPLVNLIWLAGLVFLLGSLITLWPDRREQRRLVARASEVGLPATH
jgi:cytochrome c biogenesis factor